ncbi:Thioesterase domain-containing protein [Asanoa hainanensis]|uniref:Thioesterase domain-containing protein n=1 Tax=Asanoa hainanensis TaxID=560556 RepID=A0A239N1G1_9ACTN|nr:Thioesterase domain-containing protein [Asanoa hainanensis]
MFVLGEFPLTSSGKIDRRALPMPEAESPTEYLAPRNAREELIAEVWRRELRCGPVGVDQDFLALGGNSLAAMRIAVRLAKDHGLKVSVAHVLQFRTVAALAATLGSTDDAPPAATPEEDRTRAVRSNVMSTLASAADASLVWFRRSGESTPLFCVHPGGGSAHWYQHLTDQLPASVPVAGFQHPGLLDPVDAACGTEHLAARYVDELRATRPSGPYRLFGWCGGAPIAWEMAIRLRRLGADVTLVLLDPMLQVAGLTVDGGENLRVLTACDTAYRRLAVETSPDRVASLRAEIAELLPMIVAEPHHAHLDDPDLDEVWPVAVRSWRRQIEARIPYRYAAYDGAVHLVASDELVGGFHEALAGLTFDDYVQRWRHLTSAEVTVRRVSGGNLTAMLPPHVSELAGHLVDIFPDEP